MSRRLAVNSSPIILLGRISRLDLLPGVAERVVVPQSVLRELRVKGGDDSLAGAASAHPGFDIVEDPQVAPVVQRWNLGAGEAAVLSFCLLNEGYRAVLDDLRGRRCARALNVPLFGTLGVIVEAKRRGLVPAARPLVAAIRAAGYYIDDELIVEALRQVGERPSPLSISVPKPTSCGNSLHRNQSRTAAVNEARVFERAGQMVVAALAAGLLWAQEARAIVTSRCTDTIKLDGNANQGKKDPSPRFKLNDVTVKKCLEVDSDTGRATQTCEFDNLGSVPATFIFCDMVELSSAASTVTLNNTCDILYDSVAKEWRCNPSSGSDTGAPSVHYGCQKITLGAAGTSTAQFKPPAASATSPDFVGRHASDFQVSYADIFNLEIEGAIRPFNEGSCSSCFGVNTSTNVESSGTGRPFATGFWIMSNVPITDPYIRWQELDGTLHPTEYSPLAAGPVLPSDFPAILPGIERSSPQALPPSSYDLDLLLWDIHTMSAPPEVVTPVRIDVITPEDTSGVRISVRPSETEVIGGSMEYGTLTIAQTGGTVGGTVAEGVEVPFSVAVVDPRLPTEQCWEQDGRAIQDTVPSLVTDHSVRFVGGRRLAVSITAVDVTTEPLAANFFYSFDGGSQWTTVPLRPEVEPLAGAAVNTFRSTVSLGAGVQSVLYFFSVQDGVLNFTWFGIGALEVIDDCNDNGVDDAVDIANGTSPDIDGSGEPDECEVGTATCEVQGTAAGGQGQLTIAGFSAPCLVIVPTVGGQTAATVAGNVAAGCNADGCLQAQGITCSAIGGRLFATGFRIEPADMTLVFTDPGLSCEIPAMAIPTLSWRALALLAGLLLGAGILVLRSRL